MSEYCPKCGEKTSEDDSRLCANCQVLGESGPPSGSAVFTLATLAAVMADIPKPSWWKWCAAKPELLNRLRAELPDSPKPYLTEGLYGISLYPKRQVCDSWMFIDEKVLCKYLNDELTELDLLELEMTGACQPNKAI